MAVTTKEEIKELLGKMGLPVLAEDDNGLVFRYQMNFYQATVLGSDNLSMVTIALCGIFVATDEKKMMLGLRACNEVNGSILNTRLYFDSDPELVIASDFFYREGDDMESLLMPAIQCMVLAKRRFLMKYEEIEGADRLISDLSLA